MAVLTPPVGRWGDWGLRVNAPQVRWHHLPRWYDSCHLKTLSWVMVFVLVSSASEWCVYTWPCSKYLFWLFRANLWGLIRFGFCVSVFLLCVQWLRGARREGQGEPDEIVKEEVGEETGWGGRRGRQVQQTPRAITVVQRKRRQEINVVLATWHYRLSTAVSELTSLSRWKQSGWRRGETGGVRAGGEAKKREGRKMITSHWGLSLYFLPK